MISNASQAYLTFQPVPASLPVAAPACVCPPQPHLFDCLPPTLSLLLQELCGVWAYIKWEVSGCPNRSKDEADREYAAAIQEMVMLLRRWGRGAGRAGVEWQTGWLLAGGRGR